MPPRKKVQQVAVSETPVIFFLKISDSDQESILPADGHIEYSEILQNVELSKSERFNTEILKSVLDKVSCEKYNAQTVCFWCCNGFGWTACVLPKFYDTYKNIYIAEGHFCSPECALAYNYADCHLSDSSKWLQHCLLRTLYSEAYTTRDLTPAPPRSLLRMFGGSLDIAQYREYTSGDNHIVHSETPPIRLLFPSMNVQGPLRDIKKYVCLSSDVIEKASEHLRLRRTKPVNVNIPTLDMCFQTC
uniref:MYM-type domain-containing protein n=1 Tax=viral metagenome TaxID=1070528 RepID=A0A6C0JVM5_9ZZZZ